MRLWNWQVRVEKRGIKGKRKWDGNDVNVALMYEILKKKTNQILTKKKEELFIFKGKKILFFLQSWGTNFKSPEYTKSWVKQHTSIILIFFSARWEAETKSQEVHNPTTLSYKAVKRKIQTLSEAGIRQGPTLKVVLLSPFTWVLLRHSSRIWLHHTRYINTHICTKIFKKSNTTVLIKKTIFMYHYHL